MDLYRGQYDFTNFSTQVHDFDPGINPYPSGLFWTIPLSPDAVAVDLDSGTASYRVSNLSEHDFGSIPNAITNGAVSGPPVDATVSFDLKWSRVTAQAAIANAKEGFAGNFFLTGAAMSWSAQNAKGFAFTSDPASTSNSVFALLGHERNGRFFPAGS